MRDVITLALIAAFLGGLIAFIVIENTPKAHAQLHNAYWPYSVETSIKDR